MPSTFRSIAPLVPAADVEQGIRFYRDKLGFTLLYRDAEPARFAVIALDGVEVNLFDRHASAGHDLSVSIATHAERVRHCRSA